MKLPLIEIDIRWEDTGEIVESLLVSQEETVDPSTDDAIFYYGLTMEDARECIKNKTAPDGAEFVIIAARLA